MSDYASCEIKRPLVRMVRRPTASLLHRAIVYFIALVGALLTGALLIFILGHNPLDVYVSMVQGTFGRAISFNETIKVAVPLLVTGMAVAMAFRMRFWNIGAEGQILIGGAEPGPWTKGMVSYLPDRDFLPSWMNVDSLLHFYMDFYLVLLNQLVQL